jgi:hypothetical protein
MALIKCPECLAEVSDTALSCAKCGVQLRKAKRSLLGKLIKYTFILFNLIMGWWLVAGMQMATKAVHETSGAAEHAGAAIGTGLGAVMIIFIWVVGDFILGLFVLFTRPK